MEVPHRSPFTPEGLAALLHAVCHIEFNAIDLALDAVWRFPGMPLDFYRDWLRVADEEATHFRLLQEHLQSLGHDYGDFPAHNGLWEMCVKTQHDVTARMALVPRTLEARGLDATPLIQARCARWARRPRCARWTSWTSSCATRSAMWPSATAGTAGCANGRGWTRCRTTGIWRAARSTPAAPALQRRGPTGRGVQPGRTG
jgi:hypothetical protein